MQASVLETPSGLWALCPRARSLPESNVFESSASCVGDAGFAHDSGIASASSEDCSDTDMEVGIDTQAPRRKRGRDDGGPVIEAEARP